MDQTTSTHFWLVQRELLTTKQRSNVLRFGFCPKKSALGFTMLDILEPLWNGPCVTSVGDGFVYLSNPPGVAHYTKL